MCKEFIALLSMKCSGSRLRVIALRPEAKTDIQGCELFQVWVQFVAEFTLLTNLGLSFFSFLANEAAEIKLLHLSQGTATFYNQRAI